MCEKIFTEYEYIDSIKYIQTQEIYIFGNHARVLNLKIYQFQISSYTVDNHINLLQNFRHNITEILLKVPLNTQHQCYKTRKEVCPRT